MWSSLPHSSRERYRATSSKVTGIWDNMKTTALFRVCCGHGKMTAPGLQPAASSDRITWIRLDRRAARSSLLWEVMVSKAAFPGTWPQLRPPHGPHPKLISQRTGLTWPQQVGRQHSGVTRCANHRKNWYHVRTRKSSASVQAAWGTSGDTYLGPGSEESCSHLPFSGPSRSGKYRNPG